mmetsp:Transcript_73849/g.135176  ORF Transcript_73849/g.135176 Transcript_73849/m.135176 type:complete len:254 (-) Transcript_73849:79-840(-)
MARRPIVGGNWKCNPVDISTVVSLADAFSEIDTPNIDVIIFPSAIHIAPARDKLKDTIAVGAQNIHVGGCGAFTGEMAVQMAKGAGCSWILVGHSERRHAFGETVEQTVQKVERAQEAGMGVVFCIGELLEEREAGKTLEVCQAQLAPVLPKVTDWQKFVIAYEPVWAIGTGVVATKAQAQEAHEAVRELIKEAVTEEAAATVRIQYGGSVTPENASDLISQPDIDGFLVGGASLKPTFTRIMEIVSDNGGSG